MKKIILGISAFLLFILATQSQEIPANKVPKTVSQVFAKQFPGAKAIKYETANTDFRIDFLLEGKECVVTYNATGKLLEKDNEIAPETLPSAVSRSVAGNFPGYKIMAVVRREASDMGVCYEMDLKKGEAGYSVRFAENGEILQKEARKVELKVTPKKK